MKDYLILLGVFLLFFVTINAEVSGLAPPTFGYFFCVVVLSAGLIAYRRHQSPYIKSMYTVLIPVQLLLQAALPYWVFRQSTALNISWPYFPEVLWATGALILFYYVLSFVFLPIVVLLFGRRAWCSFICGMGALAETLGDRYRTRGKKSRPLPVGFTVFKWAVLLATVALTVLALTGYVGTPTFDIVFLVVFVLFLRTLLMLAVNIILMPRFGTRIWCKYFCPQGLLLGLLSRVGRFALVRDEALCTRCGTCAKHCSMSIDITNGPVINRSGECVGCGVCVEVCPQQALSMTNDITAARQKVLRA